MRKVLTKEERKHMRKFKAVFASTALTLCIANAAETKPPMQVTQIQKEIDSLQDAKGDAFLTIQEKDGDGIVQLAGGKKTLSLNIAHYPSKQDPSKAMLAAGMEIPKT